MRKDFLAAGCLTVATVLALVTSGCTHAATAALSVAGSSVAGAAATPSAAATVNPCKATAAFAADVTGAGKVAWQVSLPPGQSSYLPPPVVSNGVAVFADNADLVGLRVADGHRLWDDHLRPDGALHSNLPGLWQWDGNVIVLIHYSDTDWRLAAVTPADGKVRWQFRFPAAVNSWSGIAADGVLAVGAGEELYALNLATGRAIWSRPFIKPDTARNYAAELLITDGVLVAGLLHLTPPAQSVFVGFRERTGHKLWTRTGLPDGPDIQADGGIVLMSGVNDLPGKQVPTPLTAFSASNGKTLWHAAVGFVYDVWTAPGQVVFGSRSGTYDVNPATGGKRWKVPGELSTPAGPSDLLLTPTDVVYYPGSGTLTDRKLSDGAVTWTQSTAPGGGYGTYITAPSGPNALIATSNNFDQEPQTAISAVNLRTGKLVASLKLPSDLPAAPAVTGSNAIYELNPEPCEYAGAPAGAPAQRAR